MDLEGADTEPTVRRPPITMTGWLVLFGGIGTVASGIAVQFFRIQRAAEDDIPFATALAWSSVITAISCVVLLLGARMLLNAHHRRRDAALRSMYPDAWLYAIGIYPEVRGALKALRASRFGVLRVYTSVVARPEQLEFWIGGSTPKLAWALPWSDVVSIERGTMQQSWKTVYVIALTVRTDEGSVVLPLPLTTQERYVKRRVYGADFDSALVSLKAIARDAQLSEGSR